MSIRTKRSARAALTRAVVFTLIGAFTTPAVLAAAGKALFVSGSVTLEGKAKKDLEVGDPIEPGDIVVTDERSRAQLLMADGARIALRASSRFRVDELLLPTNVQQPTAAAVSSAGRSVGTLLKGGFSTRDGAISKNNPSAYEMRTPIGTVGVRGACYTAVFCRGDCADAPGLPPGQPIPDGLYLAVDEGTITFNGRGLSLTLTAPRFEYIPLDTSDPRQLFDPPAFLRSDGAGAFQVAGRTVRGGAENGEIAQLNDRRGPSESARAVANVSDNRAPTERKPERQIAAISPLGRVVDLIDPQMPLESQTSVAVSVPVSSGAAFAASSTELSQMLSFKSGGNLLQLNAPLGSSGTNAFPATYLSGPAALVDFGSNGVSGIRWGRWSTGAASINTVNGAQPLNLLGSSLHWIVGPTFEVAPALPVSGSTNFVLAGGTSPTDDQNHVGMLGAGTLVADFTAQQVSTALSLDVNGYNWFATGSGTLEAGTAHFNGAYTNVLVDGRVAGTGAFSGFLSAGALASDQLSGAGVSYWLSQQQLGTVSGVLAFIPGPTQPLVPPMVVRDVAYAVGNIDGGSVGSGAAINTRTQLALDASGNLIAFDAPVPRAPVGSFNIGVASNANAGIDAATGIRWGRWEGGNIDVTTPPDPSSSNSLTGQALHWIIGNESGGPPTLAQTGTANYTLIGNTDPTDTLGNVGTLGAVSFNADFTNRTIASALTLNVAGQTWYASGSAAYTTGDHLFAGSYDDVRIQNLVRGQGTLSGFFTAPRIGSGTTPGAALSFNLSEASGQLGVISGVAAFEQGGQGGVLAPPSQQGRDIAIASPDRSASSAAFVARAAANEYALDSNFNLTNLPGLTGLSNPARYDIGTNTLSQSDVSPLVMLRWGRWSGGDVVVTDVGSGATYALDLQQRSLHWIESADSAAPPVMPQFGTYTYALIGASAPTDRSGNIGTLNNASLNANFTSQLVSASFDISINNINVIATGDGVIGAQAGLPAHQFTGAINNGVINPALGTPQGTFSGFFSAPGSNTPGVPGGAGLSYSISDGQGLFIVDGVAAFKVP